MSAPQRRRKVPGVDGREPRTPPAKEAAPFGGQSERRRLVTTIQMARKALALEDGSYRAILMRITGRDSSTTCTEPQLRALVTEFKRLGFTPKPGKGRKSQPRNGKVRVIYAIWREMEHLLDDATDDALHGFVERQTGVTSPEWLNDAQCTAVIEGLKGWRANLREQAASEGGTSCG